MGAGSLCFGLDNMDTEMSELTCHKVVPELCGALC